MYVKKLTWAKKSILYLTIPWNHIKDLQCITYTGQRRWLAKYSFIMVIPLPKLKPMIHIAYIQVFRVLHSGSEIFLPTTVKDTIQRCHHWTHEKYTNFRKFTLEKWFFLFFKFFLHLFLNKVLTTCLHPPWGRGSALQNCLWFKEPQTAPM